MLTEQNRNRTVLIVDNERVITDTLALILAQYGYQCSIAYNGDQGLARARELRPDMVISGVINGDGPNGVEMAILILDEMPHTRILLFSGQAASVDLLEAASASGHDLDLIAKPVAPIALIHWCDSGGVHDVRSCEWCRERWLSSGGAYPHDERSDCACAWCRALAAGSFDASD
jgi:CheY-like chemotaxis protein